MAWHIWILVRIHENEFSEFFQNFWLMGSRCQKIMKIWQIYKENSLKHQRKSRQNKKNRVLSSKIRLRWYIVSFLIDCKAKNAMYKGFGTKTIISDVREAQIWPKWAKMSHFDQLWAARISKILIFDPKLLYITFFALQSIIKLINEFYL